MGTILEALALHNIYVVWGLVVFTLIVYYFVLQNLGFKKGILGEDGFPQIPELATALFFVFFPATWAIELADPSWQVPTPIYYALEILQFLAMGMKSILTFVNSKAPAKK
jgi:hypothetical protein